MAYVGVNALLDYGYVGWAGGKLLALADEPVWDQAYWAGVWWRDQHWSLELVSFLPREGRVEVFRDRQGEYLENVTDAIAFLVSGQAVVLDHQRVPLPLDWAAPGPRGPGLGRPVSSDRLLAHLNRVEHPHAVLVLWSQGDWGLAVWGGASLAQVQRVLLGELQVQHGLLLCSGAPAGLWHQGRWYPKPAAAAEAALRTLLLVLAPAGQPLGPHLKVFSPGGRLDEPAPARADGSPAHESADGPLTGPAGEPAPGLLRTC